MQLRDGLGGPVVAPHQQLGRAHRVGRDEAEALRHGRLQVEDEAVLAPAGHGVQAGADQAQLAFVALQLAALERRDEAALGQRLPGLAQAGGAGDPDQHLQVAQAAGAFLAVGLQRVGRVVELGVALQALQRLGAEEGLGVHGLHEAPGQLLEELGVTGQRAGFEQRGLDGHVGLRLGEAFAQRAHRRADLQAEVPAGRDEALDGGLDRAGHVRLDAVGQQHEDVDVGVREQLAAAVAADGREAGAVGHAGLSPQRAQRVVDMAGQPAQQRLGAGLGGPFSQEAVDQRLLAGLELLAEIGERRHVRPSRRQPA